MEGFVLYVLVTWPDSQLLMEEEWFDECILAQDIEGHVEVGSSAYFVPIKRIKYEFSDSTGDFIITLK